jgi:uncharacterized membrane protein
VSAKDLMTQPTQPAFEELSRFGTSRASHHTERASNPHLFRIKVSVVVVIVVVVIVVIAVGSGSDSGACATCRAPVVTVVVVG